VESFASFKEYLTAMKELIKQGKDLKAMLEEAMGLQARLVANPALILEDLAALIEAERKSIYWPVDLNDLTIYRDPDKLFSVRLFVWEASVPYPIHDHGAWGVVAGLANQVKETKYRRLDDGRDEGMAELEVAKESVLSPGETTYVLPLNEGIHRMEAQGGVTGLTLHTYGKPIRTGFIQGFNWHNGKVYKLYPMAVHRQVVAIKALQAIGGGEAKSLLMDVAQKGNDLIKSICEETLTKM